MGTSRGELRTFQHAPFRGAVVCQIDGGERRALRASRISPGGALLVGEESRYVPGERLILTFAEWPEGVPPLSCEVVRHARASGSRGIDVRFTGLSEHQTRALVELVGTQTRPSGRWLLICDLAECVEQRLFLDLYPHAFLVPADRPLALETVVYALRSEGQPSLFHPVSVGRERGVDVRLRDKRVSRRHATFERDPSTGGYMLYDKGSQNGTWVDGVRLAPLELRALKAPTRISFGGFELRFLSSSQLFEEIRRCL